MAVLMKIFKELPTFGMLICGRDMSKQPIELFELVSKSTSKISRLAHDPTNPDSHVDNVGFGGIAVNLH